MKRLLVFVSIFLILLTGCAPGYTVRLSTPGPNPMVNQPDASGRIAGAGEGLWHGIISPVTLVMSFFDPNVHIYEVHNSGSAYDIGFLIGLLILLAVISLFLRLRR